MKALEFKTLQEAAQILGVSQRTLERHLKRHADGMPDGSVVRPGAPRPTLISIDAIDYLRQEIQPKTQVVIDDNSDKLKKLEQMVISLQREVIRCERDKAALMAKVTEITLTAAAEINKLEARNVWQRISRQGEGQGVAAVMALTTSTGTESSDDTGGRKGKLNGDDSNERDSTDNDDDDTTATS